jgi:hypothetical protein
MCRRCHLGRHPGKWWRLPTTGELPRMPLHLLHDYLISCSSWPLELGMRTLIAGTKLTGRQVHPTTNRPTVVGSGNRAIGRRGVGTRLTDAESQKLLE